MSILTTAPVTGRASGRSRWAKWPKWLLWSSMAALSLFIAFRFEFPMFGSVDEQGLFRSALMWLLLPHILAATTAFVIGPLQFSDRLRADRPSLHRKLGYLYICSVFVAAAFALVLASLRHPNQQVYYHWMVSVQATAWLITTAGALLTARNGYIQQHRQWAFRSYAVTFTFIAVRTHQIIPRMKVLTPAGTCLFVVTTTLAAILVADLMSQRRMLFGRRSSQAHH